MKKIHFFIFSAAVFLSLPCSKAYSGTYVVIINDSTNIRYPVTTSYSSTNIASDYTTIKNKYKINTSATCNVSGNTVTCTCPSNVFYDGGRCLNGINDRSLTEIATCESVSGYTYCNSRLTCNYTSPSACKSATGASSCSYKYTYTSSVICYYPTNCPDGYTLTNGKCVSKGCTAGQFLNGTTCTGCAAGTYSSGGTVTSCTKCAAGYYASGTGNSSCIKSTAITNYSAYSTTEDKCMACNSGYTLTNGQCVRQNTVNGSCPDGLSKSADGCCCVK